MGPGPNPYLHGASLELITYRSDDIRYVSNWGYWYMVGNMRMAAMELDNAVFYFPDGSSGGGRLRIDSFSRVGNDMGHAIDIGHETIMLVVEKNGMEFATPWKPGDPTFTWAESKTPERR